MSIADKLVTVSENVSKVYEAGKSDERNTLWDAIQNYGKRTSYQEAFRGFDDKTFTPKYSMSPTNVTEMFYYSKITDLVDILDRAGITINLRNLTTIANGVPLYRMFCYSKITTCPELRLPTVKNDGGKGFNLNCMFFGCSNLEVIQGLDVVESTIFTETFRNCSALKEIRFSGSIGNNISFAQSSRLSKDSIISIVDALSDSVSGKILSLSKTAVNNAFSINIDDESTYPADSEYYTLRHSKDNWTFSYV